MTLPCCYRKNTIFTLTLLVISSLLFGQDSNISTETIPTRKIKGDSLYSFIDSLKKEILADTSLFNQDDLWNISNNVENKKDYSPLYIVNMTCQYKLDIINGSLVNEFIREFIDLQKIQEIDVLDSLRGEIYFGVKGKNGIIFITTKKEVKVNYKVAGLRKLYKKRQSANFNELLPGKPRYYY